uniref:Uncharacterized protein n=1 Tax=Pararge aegeria TaxID=116150 RepID=S4PBM9_9NEOP
MTTVYCGNVKRQVELDDRNPFINYRNEDRDEQIGEREWQRRREIERRNQRQRARDQQDQQRYIIEWIEGNYEENEQQRYEWEKQQQLLRERAEEEEYERQYQLGRNVQPYWTPYDSRVVYPWTYPIYV